MHSVQLWKILSFTIWSPSAEIAKSHGRCCFLVPPECRDLFYTVYPLDLPTNKSHKGMYRPNVPNYVAK